VLPGGERPDELAALAVGQARIGGLPDQGVAEQGDVSASVVHGASSVVVG
jgi:hypothetical protein